jgi:hypothetical protein
MTEAHTNSSSNAPGLNESQARRLRVTCQYIDKILGDIESVLNISTSKAAFPRYSPDIAPVQRRTIEDYLSRIRAQLVRVLESQGIAREEPQIPASRAVHVMLGAVDLAVEELEPKYVRGYGEVPESVATESNGVVGELAGYRARADQALSGKAPNAEEIAAIHASLLQLEADAAPEKDLTNSARTHASYLPETSSKLPEVFQGED